MNTPVADFVQRYAKAGTARLHMPGHKGRCFLGCEPWDITEIHGADALYEAEGILAESEQNAAALFGSQRISKSSRAAAETKARWTFRAATTVWEPLAATARYSMARMHWLEPSVE